MIEGLLLAACGTTLAASAMAGRLHRRAQLAERTVGRLQAELRAERHAASHDPLTGLLNRRAFHQAAKALLADPARPPLAAVVADLDDFKSINDRMGHAVGDHVLSTVARRLRLFAGDNPVARLGGDEFVGLLLATHPDERWLELTARRLTELLAAPIPLGRYSVPVSASVGLAPVTGSNLAAAIRDADADMYRMKLAGPPPAHHLLALAAGVEA